MNVYQYLNSKDVAEYLEKIGFQFTSLEAARVIENCNHINLAEKHDAFRLLMEKVPDEEITLPAECGREAEETTLHSLLQEYIAAENELAQGFEREEENCVYSCIMGGFSIHPAYMTYQSFKKELLRLLKADVDYIHLSKLNLETREETYLCIDGKGNARLVENLHVLYEPYTVLRMEWGERRFPLPFEKGDLVNKYGEKNRPFVFLEMDFMSVTGYFLENGTLIKAEEYASPFELEYFRSEPSDEKKALQMVSSFVKEYLNLTEFANLYHKAMLEGYTEKIRIS